MSSLKSRRRSKRTQRSWYELAPLLFDSRRGSERARRLLPLVGATVGKRGSMRVVRRRAWSM